MSLLLLARNIIYKAYSDMAIRRKTKLKSFLEEKGIKMVWLAGKTGLDYQRVIRIIDGSEPSLKEARLICAALERAEHELFEITAIENSFTKNTAA